MRMRILAVSLTAGAVALMTTAITGTAATAVPAKRPCGPAVMSSGAGTLGTGWTLKSQYDDDGPNPGGLVAGEEFQINTEGAGQHWTVVLSDNGTAFFTNDDDVSTATGINETHPNPTFHHITNVMSAHAVRHDTGEVIDGSVTLPPAPAACAPGTP